MEKSERRKKIIARGTDRMALITGRIQSLDPDPILKSTSFTAPRSDSLTVQHARSSSEPGAANQDDLIPDEIHHDDEPDIATRDYNNEEISKRNHPEIRVKRTEKREASRFKPENSNLPEKQHSNLPEKQHSGCILSCITPNEINFSIITTEETRAICSIALAFLVLLSHIVLPHYAAKQKSLITCRPLYVVVLTDVFVVAAKLVPYAHKRKEIYNEPVVIDEVDGDNWGGAFKYLELGLVLHQTIRALFIDCSLYLVAVVCGNSMVN